MSDVVAGLAIGLGALTGAALPVLVVELMWRRWCNVRRDV